MVDDSSGTPIPGATVSAQIFDTNDDIVEQSAKTGAEGDYKFFLPPDVYNVVVTADDYLTACKVVDASFYEEYSADFRLTPWVHDGTDITLTVNVAGLADGASVALSIRQPDFTCTVGESETLNTTIEVASDNVQNGSYSFILPAGTYELVADTSTGQTQGPIQFTSDTEENLDFTPAP